MTTKDFAKHHGDLYMKPPDWSEAWYKSFMELIAELLATDEVDCIPLPGVGTLKKDYVFPSTYKSLKTGEVEVRPGHMSLTFIPASKLMEKVKVLPERPELASARKKRYRADMPQRRVPDPPMENTDESANETNR